jgi:Cu(I)/Ag(I) efflux system membrane fusion protein
MSDAGAALAADDFTRYVDRQARVRDAFRDLVEFDPECARALIDTGGEVLTPRDNMADARVDFARFSTAVSDVMRSRKQLHAAGLRLFECKMAPVVGTARWLQREASPRNPFFGASMLECGAELDAVSVARALPPGHPPIGHLTPEERAMYSGSPNVPATGGSTGGGCGSCGMSMEAMAAGEPCEHDKK